MHRDQSENLLIFHQAPAPGSPEERLERAVREIFGGMRARNGRALDYDVRRNKVNPLRTVATKLRRARQQGVPRSQVLKLEKALHDHIETLWPEQADDFSKRRMHA